MSNKIKKNNLWTTNKIRQVFLDYFREHHHEIIASSSLIPHNDPTLLFTNAGMVQFKDVFLGKEKKSFQRAASSQRCVRAGGKHNDLENVGYTARHHTFFEMLGNFSFGDYFKEEAIAFAWDFLTTILKLPKEKLWITVFKDDHETAEIWLKKFKIDPNHFSYCDEKNNFWAMGSTGPCGPCTEIFYDHGENIPGGPPGSPDEDGDRYVEIWNIVFMQYDRKIDGTLTPLGKPCVDTGMGLERIAAVMQGVHNNYDIDLFHHLIKSILDLSHERNLPPTSLRVIADHIRSCAFLIADGVIPSNEGRGYVLRRIIRRAIRHGAKLNLPQPFFYRLVEPLLDEMGEAYPELIREKIVIEKLLRQEEEQFLVTLEQGLKVFEEKVAGLKSKIIPGDIIFQLYDTYGFPIDLTADIARERDLSIDEDGFETAMTKQRERSRQAGQFAANYDVARDIDSETEFTGYDCNSHETKIIALYRENQSVEKLQTGERGSIILDRTPFYAESGGQVGDQGLLKKNTILFRVMDTKKQGKMHIHIGKVEKGELQVGDVVMAEIDNTRRTATVLNHTATHLLHHVLRDLFGEHLIQKGSLVEPERLRFDFSHPTPLTSDDLRRVEKKMNEEIRANHEGILKITTPEEAVKQGAMSLFGEKYGDEVRVVHFGKSIELCGGTHAHHTGDIGLFKIISESGVASGIRRIEAVTGEKALQWIEERELQFTKKIMESENQIRECEKEIHQLKIKLAGNLSLDLASSAKEIQGIKILIKKIDGVDAKSLRNMIDQLKNKLHNAIIVLAVVVDKKITIAVGVTKNHIDKIKAGELVNFLAEQVGGKGGGRPDFAEAGGNQIEKLESALASVDSWIEKKLNAKEV